MAVMRYTRVKDGKGNHFDVLIDRFDPKIHTLVESGPKSGESTRPRPPKNNVKTSKPKRPKAPKVEETSGQPSGETPTTEQED